MKKLIFIALLSVSFTVNAQTKVIKDVQGNYFVDSTKVSNNQKDTGKTFKNAKGEVFKVYESKAGKLFYIKTAKTSGKKYNVYLIN